MPVYVRPFKASDLDAFVPIEPMTKDEIKDPELAEAIEKSGLAVTGVRNGQVVGCGGVHPIDKEQGEVWLRLSAECLKHKFDTLQRLRDSLKIIEEVYPFRQLNVAIQDCYERGKKLAKYLGFNPIQTKDGFVIYAKLVKD